MFRIAKNLVKTFEQSVQGLSQDSNQLDAFFQSIPPNLIAPQFPETGAAPDLSSIAGLRVLFVDEFQLQLQSYFDYIVGINGMALPLVNNQHGYMYPDYNTVISMLNAGTTQNNGSVTLNVWSAKGGSYRDVYLQLRPKDVAQMEDVALNSEGQAGKLFEPLGFKVQWAPLVAATYTYHILQLNIANGPACTAGLIPDEDYIIGCQDGLLATGGDTLLQDIVRSRAGQELVLYVYNKVSDSVRPITVAIGPDGRLGCGIGSGFLHRIPSPRGEANAPVPAAALQAEVEVPVQQTFSPQFAQAPPHASHKKKKHAAPAAGGMSDYFTEGKDQSPRPSTPAQDTSVPPPPITNHK